MRRQVGNFVGIALVAASCLSGCGAHSNAAQDQQMAQQALLDNVAMRGGAVITESSNILQNPGFERGTEQWKWLDWSKGWAAFEASTTHAYEGQGSLHLPVQSDARPTIVWGGVQEPVLTEDIPECVEGYYFVESWSKADEDPWSEYLQFVVIDTSHSLGEKRGQAQLRYIIAGSKTPPLNISNAQYLFMEPRTDRPVVGQWTRFTANPREDFQKNWQYTPTKGAKLRVLFEARYDNHREQQKAVSASVYFDNLYMGPKTATRCAD